MLRVSLHSITLCGTDVIHLKNNFLSDHTLSPLVVQLGLMFYCQEISYSIYDNLLELWKSECLDLACNPGVRSFACDQPSMEERSAAESPFSYICFLIYASYICLFLYMPLLF